jgi:hypothetical protein
MNCCFPIWFHAHDQRGLFRDFLPVPQICNDIFPVYPELLSSPNISLDRTDLAKLFTHPTFPNQIAIQSLNDTGAGNRKFYLRIFAGIGLELAFAHSLATEPWQTLDGTGTPALSGTNICAAEQLVDSCQHRVFKLLPLARS